jgi:hypothetical protein
LSRKYVFKQVIEENMEGTGRRGRKHKQLLVELKDRIRHWKYEKEELHCILWRTRFGRRD